MKVTERFYTDKHVKIEFWNNLTWFKQLCFVTTRLDSEPLFIRVQMFVLFYYLFSLYISICCKKTTTTTDVLFSRVTEAVICSVGAEHQNKMKITPVLAELTTHCGHSSPLCVRAGTRSGRWPGCSGLRLHTAPPEHSRLRNGQLDTL